MVDWYRNKTWTSEIEEHFFAKLARARKDGRAQYLRIQAVELVETQNQALLDVAEKLINKIFIEYPDDRFERPVTLTTLGKIYLLRNDQQKAMGYYKEALDFEIIYPKVKTQAFLEYSELVIKTETSDKYDEVMQMLVHRIPDELFPLVKYKGYSILSIINSYKGDEEQARHFAALAEKHASQEISGLRYHKELGVVKERDSWLDKLVDRR